MAGIVGIISKHSKEANINNIDKMIKTINYDNYFNSGKYINDKVGIYLGWVVHKNSFVDCMPVWNEKKDKCLVLYGESFADSAVSVYLKGKGHIFSQNNAEYLIHLYEDIGDNWFKSLNGFYHGVLIDIQQNEIVLFNDRYGMQRLYINEKENYFVFSSEAKSILKIRPELREIVPSSLGQFVSMGCVLNNNTLFKNIYLFPGGSIYRFRNGLIQKKYTYFQPSDWENQAPAEKNNFYYNLRNTFRDILPRYLNDSRAKGLSLTGGLDSRLILAYADRHHDKMTCYTFGSMYRDSFDVKVAKQISILDNLKHITIKLDKQFLIEFPSLAEKTVYITDGYLDVSGATELYVNKIARGIAPIRITGNYGSEVLRNVIAFRPIIKNNYMYNIDFRKYISKSFEEYKNTINGNRISFALFKQAPWFNYNRLALEQSQLTMRTPFMDNDFVSEIYKAPSGYNMDDSLLMRLIQDGHPKFSKVITNRGVGGNSFELMNKPRETYYEIIRLAEYFFDYGMPQWFSFLDYYLSPLHIERLFLGQDKFYHFRIWYKYELSEYIKEILLDKKTLERPIINKIFVNQMVKQHVKGNRNYTKEIEKLITIELIYRLLIEK